MNAYSWLVLCYMIAVGCYTGPIRALARNLNNNRHEHKKSAIVCNPPRNDRHYDVTDRPIYDTIKRIYIPPELYASRDVIMPLSELQRALCTIEIHTRNNDSVLCALGRRYRDAISVYVMASGLVILCAVNWDRYKSGTYKQPVSVWCFLGAWFLGIWVFRRVCPQLPQSKKAAAVFRPSECSVYGMHEDSLWYTMSYQATLGELVQRKIVAPMLPFPALAAEGGEHDRESVRSIILPLIVDYGGKDRQPLPDTWRLAVARFIQCINHHDAMTIPGFQDGTILTQYPDVPIDTMCSTGGLSRKNVS